MARILYIGIAGEIWAALDERTRADWQRWVKLLENGQGITMPVGDPINAQIFTIVEGQQTILIQYSTSADKGSIYVSAIWHGLGI